MYNENGKICSGEMNMKVIVVFIAEFLKTPPVLSVIKALDDLGHEVVVCTIGDKNSDYYNNLGEVKNVGFRFVNDSYSDSSSMIGKFTRMYKIRERLWNIIDEIYDDNTLLWVISDVSVKHLGKRLISKRYLIHFLELIEDMYYISGNSLLKMDREAYVNNAKVIIECEYNRAHITKAWWSLKTLPSVLPNKPYISIDIEKNSDITSSSELKGLIKRLEGKKIVLYQGNISKERPLNSYIEAVRELGDEWAFIMMLNGENPYPDLKANNVFYVPFVSPPFHLEVTSHAYIGVLSYVPVKNSHSILNTLYCAPNKIWEYSKYGVPMISNDLPALRYSFETKGIGECVDQMNTKGVIEKLLQIDSDYAHYSRNSYKFFDSLDFKSAVKKILDKAVCKQ